MPVSTVFENFESGATIDEIIEWFDVTREQVVAVLEFAARSLDAPPVVHPPKRPMRILFDHGTPAPLIPFPGGHTTATGPVLLAAELAWDRTRDA
jgi:poly(3-hydroxybutyrate) depolymerase